ncbi:hypothetical protein [Catenulispora subtropica]
MTAPAAPAAAALQAMRLAEVTQFPSPNPSPAGPQKMSAHSSVIAIAMGIRVLGILMPVVAPAGRAWLFTVATSASGAALSTRGGKWHSFEEH